MAFTPTTTDLCTDCGEGYLDCLCDVDTGDDTDRRVREAAERRLAAEADRKAAEAEYDAGFRAFYAAQQAEKAAAGEPVDSPVTVVERQPVTGRTHDVVHGWLRAVSRAFTGDRSGPYVFASMLATYVNVHTMEVFAGTPKIAKDFGRSRGRMSEQRQDLVDAGWLTDTGKRRGRAVIWQLSQPS